jgi:hypothetical protein
MLGVFEVWVQANDQVMADRTLPKEKDFHEK